MLLDSLAGALAVVTGGARGIGRGIARTLLGEGAAVVIASRTRSDLDEACEELAPLGQVTAVREQSSYVTGAVLPVDGGQSAVLSMPISIELGEEAR